MRHAGPKTRVRLALKRILAEISALREPGDLFSRGLASEGYSGGYRDALMDVELLLNGSIPNRRSYWDIKQGGREPGHVGKGKL